MPVKWINGIPVNPLNRVTEGDGFYISYNPSVVDYGDVTTALVDDSMSFFYILLGDHRKEYAPLIPQGFLACLKYYHDTDGKSKFSDPIGLEHMEMLSNENTHLQES